jgi:hypothetical protein
VLRRILGPKREELIGGWRKLHSEGLPGLQSVTYCYDDEMKEDMMDRSCGTYGDEQRCIQDFDGETRRYAAEDLSM